MSRLFASLVAAVATVAGACGSAEPGTPQAEPVSPVAADILRLANEIERIHPNPFHTVPRDVLRARFDDLARRAPGLTRDQAVVELMRATVLGPRDGHGGLYPFGEHERPLHLYPLRLWAFPEGLYVVGSRAHQALVGTRLVAIGGLPAEEVAARVRPLISYDNEASLLLRVPEFMITAEVLQGLGLVADARRAVLTFERPGGARVETRLTPIPATRYVGTVVSDFMEIWRPPSPPGPRAPLWLRNAGSPRWFASLDGGRVVYASYSMTVGSTFGFATELARRARAKRVRRVILDVRLNGGGDNTTYAPLIAALRRPPLNRPGLVVLVTGRVTFSAAGNFAAEVDVRTRARIVGEAAGGSPHNYGDRRSVELPSLGLTVYVAPQYVQVLDGPDERVATEPDVPVELSARDFFAGRDPVLAAAVRLR